MFYSYDQSPPGGYLIRDNDVVDYVIIEADSADEANERAESIGIYFDGVQDDRDCPCCCDRWSRAYNGGGTIVPMIYGEQPVEEYRSTFTPKGEVYAYVYYKNGTRAAFSQGEE